MEPVNVLYFGVKEPSKRRPFPIKTLVIWVPGTCRYVDIYIYICACICQCLWRSCVFLRLLLFVPRSPMVMDPNDRTSKIMSQYKYNVYIDIYIYTHALLYIYTYIIYIYLYVRIHSLKLLIRTNMVPENRTSQKKCSSTNHPIFRCFNLVSKNPHLDDERFRRFVENSRHERARLKRVSIFIINLKQKRQQGLLLDCPF